MRPAGTGVLRLRPPCEGSVRRGPRLGTGGRIGLGLLGLMVVVAVLAPLLAPYDGVSRDSLPYQRPGDGHLLGTDDLGRDLWSQLLLGARPSLVVGFSVAALAIAIGTTVGGAAASTGGWTDAWLMRSADVVLTMPFLPVVVLAAAFLGPGLGVRVLTISLLTWATSARVVRVCAAAALQRPHAEVARAAGASRWWLLTRHASPTVLPVLVPLLARAAAMAIVLDASLNFLGLGDPTKPSWGTTLSWANVRGAFVSEQWLWWALPPGLALALVSFGLALIGTSVEERLNPTLAALR